MKLQAEIIYNELKFYFDKTGIEVDGDTVNIDGYPIAINLKMIAGDANNETHNRDSITVTNINEAKLLLMYLKSHDDTVITRTPITTISDVIHHKM